MNDIVTVLAMADEFEKTAAPLPVLGQALAGGARRLVAPLAVPVGRLAERTGVEFLRRPQEFLAGAPGRIAEWAGSEGGRAALQTWGGRLATSGAGAVGGGAIGAATAGPEADTGDRLRRAIAGATLGGAAGLVGGQFVTRAGRGQASRAAKRQAHAFTGYVPRTEDQIARGVGFSGAGMTPAERLQALQQMRVHVGNMNLEQARAAGHTGVKAYLKGGSREAAERGMTSAPGVIRELIKNPVEAAKIGIGSGGALGALMLGGYGASQIPHVMRQNPGGPGRVENTGQLIGETVGYALGSPVPFVGNVALGGLGGTIGKYLGRGVSRVGQHLAPSEVGGVVPR